MDIPFPAKHKTTPEEDDENQMLFEGRIRRSSDREDNFVACVEIRMSQATEILLLGRSTFGIIGA
jgi:hypothetical protein